MIDVFYDYEEAFEECKRFVDFSIAELHEDELKSLVAQTDITREKVVTYFHDANTI